MNACLAAALLFPAVAAIHGIVLATLHVDGTFFYMFAIISNRESATPLHIDLHSPCDYIHKSQNYPGLSITQ